MSKYNYRPIVNFGCNKMLSQNDNPLSYCIGDNLDIHFNHAPTGVTYGQYNKKCQIVTSDHCSENWNSYCELLYQDKNVMYPNALLNSTNFVSTADKLTAGEILLQNSARKHFISGSNAEIKCEPFDPNVVGSPMVCFMNNTTGTVSEYEIKDPKNADKDIILNKLLDKPEIDLELLINIFNTMSRKGTLRMLSNTRIGKFFQQPYFQGLLNMTKQVPKQQLYMNSN